MITKEELKAHICERLKYYRKQANLSMIEVAKRINSSSGHITYIEKGVGVPSIVTIKKLCEVYGIKSSDILPF